jgi:trans-aconitate methyltransferase
MSVSSHLGIDLAEYDSRIRTFIPFYEEMLDVAAEAVPARARDIVDLGVGTGALALRCLARAPGARLTGVDMDAEILEVARRRLPPQAKFLCGSFLRISLPPATAVTASFSLHHIRTRAARRGFYRKLRKSLMPGGVLLAVDCYPASDPALASSQFQKWKSHLERSYSAREAAGFLKAWSQEDVYVPLHRELELLGSAGFVPEVLWRKDAFAVLLAK